MKMMEKPLHVPAPPPQPPQSTGPPRATLTDEEIEKIDKDGLISKWKDLEKYVNFTLEKKAGDKDTTEKLTLQQQEATRRENVLMMRLATKEQEMQELLAQIQELKQAQTPSAQQLQTMLIDPAVNLLFEKMKTELTETKDRLEQAQNDLSAWKFTPDSVTGKKLMAKCRTLIQENQELGKQLSQGRIAQLEAELSLQKKYSEELKGSQDEMNEFVIQLDEEVEGMQATICVLQQQLKESKQLSDKLSVENENLKAQVDELVQSSAAIQQQVNGVQDVSMNEDSPPPPKQHAAPPVVVAPPPAVVAAPPCAPEVRTASPEKVERTTKQRDALSPSQQQQQQQQQREIVVPPTAKHDEPKPQQHSLRHDNNETATATSPVRTHEEPMQVDNVVRSTRSTRSHRSKAEHKDYNETSVRESTRSAKTKVIQQAETTKLAESPHVSPPKGAAVKTSFSISDLLSGAEKVRKDGLGEPAGLETDPETTTTTTQPLNGEIDDDAI